MTPEASVLIWLIVFIIVLLILKAYGIRTWSAIVFALAVALIILMLVYPFRLVNGFYRAQGLDGLVAFIGFITAILIIIYIVQKVFSDRDPLAAWGATKVETVNVVTTSTTATAPMLATAVPVISTTRPIPATCF